MKLPNATHRQLLETLRGQLIPWANSGAPFVLLSAPPRMLGSLNVSEQPGKALPLQHGRGHMQREQCWREENMNSASVPYFGCVTEGEADLVVGTTTAMCRKMKIPGKRWIVQMPKGTFFLVPPGIPFCGAEKVHWERPHPEKAHSRISWIHLQETGGSYHSCTSAQGQHQGHPFLFLPSTQLITTAQAIIHEMQVEPSQYVPVLYHQLSLLLHYMMRSLLATPEAPDLREVEMPLHEPLSGLTQKALLYIEENLRNPSLSVEEIAAHLYYSPMHLNRIFHHELHSTVMAFVIKRRLEFACQLLRQSKLTINQIRSLCCYAHSSSFIRVFKQHFGLSPSEYRSQHRNDVIQS